MDLEHEHEKHPEASGARGSMGPGVGPGAMEMTSSDWDKANGGRNEIPLESTNM